MKIPLFLFSLLRSIRQSQAKNRLLCSQAFYRNGIERGCHLRFTKILFHGKLDEVICRAAATACAGHRDI
ncbi:MAG: hypothetical protein ACK4N1_02525, partial [Pseudorhizobium sp.]